MENEDLIRLQMQDTRESLTDKLETLEKKLADSVEVATSAVNDTVAGVKETVHDSVESVKSAVDVKAHVDHHPWIMIGGSVLCGYVLGTMLSGDRESRREREPAPAPAKPQHTHGNGKHKQKEQRADPSAMASTSWLSAVEPELRQLKSLALGATLGTVREILAKEIPPNMAETLRAIIDGVTKKIGADPIPSTDFTSTQTAATATQSRSGATGALEMDKPRW